MALKPLARRALLGIALFAGLACLAAAQTTGAVEGRVIEPSGAGLPGVSIEARSPSLQGVRTATTAKGGTYRLPALPPGQYKIRAFLKGFTTVDVAARVSLNSLARADFTLQFSAEESIVVQGSAPALDLGSAATGTTYAATVLRRIAIIRNYADILRLQPGVQPDTAATQGRAAPLAIYGSTSIENLYLIEGVNTNNVKQSFQGTVLNPETIEEVEIKTGGYGAEYGHAVGGIINAVTRSGGNDYHGDAYGFYNSVGMRAASKANSEQDILQAEQTNINRWDAGLDLGGYLWKDRLWFFGSYDRIGQTTYRLPLEGVDAGGTYPFDTSANVFSGKLTWNASASTSVVATAFGDPEQRAGATGPLAGQDPVTYTATRLLGGISYAGRVNQLLGANNMLFFQFSRHQDGYQTDPSPGWDNPVVRDFTVPGLQSLSGGYGVVFGPTDNYTSSRNSAAGSWTSYLGNQEIKAGGEWERTATTSTSRYFHGVSQRVYPCNPDPFNPDSVVDYCDGTGAPYVNWQGKSVPGGVYYNYAAWYAPDGAPISSSTSQNITEAYAAYAEDTWRILPNLTVTAGLRWEQERINDSGNQTVIDLTAMWAPRVGVVWDFLGNGTSKAFASFGRFYYHYPMDLSVRGFNEQDACLYYSDTPPEGPQGCTIGAFHEPVDAGLKGMYQDEFTVGVEKALDPTFVVGIKGNYQNLGRAIEDRCDLDYSFPVNQGSTCAIVNPGSSAFWASGQAPCFNGNTRPDFAVLYPGYKDSEVCNENGGPAVPKAARVYKGLELTARKSIGDQFWIQAWYIYSSLKGTYDGAARLTDGQTDPGINLDFDYWQFVQNNTSGRLYLDRPHAAQIATTYYAPFGLIAGFTGYVRSGPPRNQLIYFNDNYGAALYEVPRGAYGRAPLQYEINLALGYQWKLGPVSVTPRLYVYNLLNRQGATRVNDNYNECNCFDESGNDIQNTNFGKIVERQDPRLFRMMVRVSF